MRITQCRASAHTLSLRLKAVPWPQAATIPEGRHPMFMNNIQNRSNHKNYY